MFNVIAKALLKLLGPLDGYKTWIGYGIAVAFYFATQLGIEIPVLGNTAGEIFGVLLGTFGLGHKGGKA